MLPTFSDPKAKQAPGGTQEHELTVSGSNECLFQDWVKVLPRAQTLHICCCWPQIA